MSVKVGPFKVNPTNGPTVDKADSDAVISESEHANASVLISTHFAKGNGRERIVHNTVDGNDPREVQERAAAMHRYIALKGVAGVEAHYKKAGPIPAYINKALGEVKRERAKIGTIGAPQFKLFTYSSTDLKCFTRANNKRVAAAKEAAKAFNAGGAALDASDNNLGAAGLVKNQDDRASLLMDAVLQFMAERRTSEMIDAYGKTEEERTANDMGRLPTSGPIAVLELQKYLQTVGSGASSEATREYALARSQGGKLIVFHPAVQLLLGSAEARVVSCRAALRGLADDASIRTAAMLKVRVLEDCAQAVSDSLQVFGGYGYMEDYRLEKRLRDALTLKSLGGRRDDLVQRIAMTAGEPRSAEAAR